MTKVLEPSDQQVLQGVIHEAEKIELQQQQLHHQQQQQQQQHTAPTLQPGQA